MDNQLSIHLVTGYEPLLIGLAQMIESEPGLSVCGMSGSIDEMSLDDSYRHADVIVADVEALDSTDPGALAARVSEWIPGMRMLFLSGENETHIIEPGHTPIFLSARSVGFIQKTGSSERLANAIRLVAADAFVCESEVIRDLLTRLARWANTETVTSVGQLSERETEVLALVAQGRSNREIATQLIVAEGTVKIHVSHILNKLDMDRRTELVRFAIAQGVAPL